MPFVGRPRLFEMPLLGYGGYLPFALEVFAVWSLLQGIARPGDDRWPGFLAASGDSRRGVSEAR